jgi:hypothetical protein
MQAIETGVEREERARWTLSFTVKPDFFKVVVAVGSGRFKRIVVDQ